MIVDGAMFKYFGFFLYVISVLPLDLVTCPVKLDHTGLLIEINFEIHHPLQNDNFIVFHG